MGVVRHRGNGWWQGICQHLKMLAKSGLGSCHGVQCWKEKSGKKLLDKMEVPWSKNKGRKSGVMRALERLKIVVTWKAIKTSVSAQAVSVVGVGGGSGEEVIKIRRSRNCRAK